MVEALMASQALKTVCIILSATLSENDSFHLLLNLVEQKWRQHTLLAVYGTTHGSASSLAKFENCLIHFFAAKL